MALGGPVDVVDELVRPKPAKLSLHLSCHRVWETDDTNEREGGAGGKRRISKENLTVPITFA